MRFTVHRRSWESLTDELEKTLARLRATLEKMIRPARVTRRIILTGAEVKRWLEQEPSFPKSISRPLSDDSYHDDDPNDNLTTRRVSAWFDGFKILSLNSAFKPILRLYQVLRVQINAPGLLKRSLSGSTCQLLRRYLHESSRIWTRWICRRGCESLFPQSRGQRWRRI